VKISDTFKTILILFCLLSFLGASSNKCSILPGGCKVNENFHPGECSDSEHSGGCEYCSDCICKENFDNHYALISLANLPFTLLEFHNQAASIKNFSTQIERPPQNLI
jgi:hypothetical protein